MLKNLLLASVAFVSFNSIQATQPLHPPAHPHQGQSMTQNSEDMEPCPPDGKAWIINDGHRRYMLIKKTGEKIDLDHPGQSTTSSSTSTHHDAEHHPHQPTEDERNLARNPHLTAEEEALRVELEAHGIGSLYTRNGNQEFGKEYAGTKYPHGVYFQTETGKKGYKPGLWVLDSHIKAKGLSTAAIPTIKKPKRAKPTPTDIEVKKPGLVPPGAVGLTVRTNTAQTNPQTRKVELSQGRANVAQTGLTGQAAPHIDTSGTMEAILPSPAAPPPPPPLPPARRTASTPSASAAPAVDAAPAPAPAAAAAANPDATPAN